MLRAKIKDILRPCYHALGRPLSKRDKPSMLGIDSFGGFEIAYRKNTADEDVIGHSFDKDIFFSRVPEHQPCEGDVIVDIGAHIGTFSLLASSKVGSGKVYAIEACEDSINFLRINVALNRCDNVSVHHLAIADQDGTCILYHSAGNWGHSTVARKSKDCETVPSSSLATFFEKNHIMQCDFMKLNCEGAEFPILLGTPSAYLQRIKTLLVLYHCDLWRKNKEVDLIAHLESIGFHCDVRNRSTGRGWIVAVNQTGISSRYGIEPKRVAAAA